MSRIEQLIGEIEEYIDSCKYQPLSNTKILVNKEEMEELLVELRLRVPEEIKKYQKIISQQDAILADKERAAVVDLIDIRYWHYQSDGTAYAPQGGQNLAPRQHARLLKPKKTSFEQVYRAVTEYRTQYPEKAVSYSADSYDAFGWAIFMAGGSLSNVPAISQSLLAAATAMKPFAPQGNTQGQYVLGNPGKAYVLYNSSDASIKLDLSQHTGNYIVQHINPRSGKVLKKEKIKAGTVATFSKLSSADEVIFISKI